MPYWRGGQSSMTYDGDMVMARWWWWDCDGETRWLVHPVSGLIHALYIRLAWLTHKFTFYLVTGSKLNHPTWELPYQAKEMLLLLLSTLLLIILTKWGFERRAKFRILANYGYNVRQICPVYYIIPYLYEKPRCLQSTTYLGTSTRLPRTTLAQCLTG